MRMISVWISLIVDVLCYCFPFQRAFVRYIYTGTVAGCKTDQGEIVGYILLTRVEIVSESEIPISLAIAPLAVLPEYQNRGIGRMFLEEAHKRAAEPGYGTAVLLGHKDRLLSAFRV